MTPYYRVLARKIALAIVVVAFIPYALTFSLFYTSYNDSLRGQVLGALQTVVETHKRDIEDFLAERLANLQAMGAMLGVPELSQKARMQHTLQALRQAHGAFVDLHVTVGRGARAAEGNAHQRGTTRRR